MKSPKRAELLSTIRNLIEGEPLWPQAAFSNIEHLEDRYLKVLLISLFRFDRARKQLGQASDVQIKKLLKKQMEQINQITKQESHLIRSGFESKIKDEEMQDAEVLISHLK